MDLKKISYGDHLAHSHHQFLLYQIKQLTSIETDWLCVYKRFFISTCRVCVWSVTVSLSLQESEPDVLNTCKDRFVVVVVLANGIF